MLDVDPGTYPVGRILVRVGVDNVARLWFCGRAWSYCLVDSARGHRVEDARFHVGAAEERIAARAIAVVALRRARRQWLQEQQYPLDDVA